jgi:hypothetical protein
MSARDPRIDACIAAAEPFARPILEHLRALVHEACPGVEETLKWRMPTFVAHGSILCTMAAFGNTSAADALYENLGCAVPAGRGRGPDVVAFSGLPGPICDPLCKRGGRNDRGIYRSASSTRNTG